MRRIWRVKPVDEAAVQDLAHSLNVPVLIARLLIHRGTRSTEEAHDFLCGELSSLAPPEWMTDLKKAVHLIRQAVSQKDRILLVGDYDADGLTGTALLCWVIRGLGAQVDCHIPHRMTDGYGLKPEVVKEAASRGVKLLIAVDCGTTSFNELALASRLGMKTIVVDHHDLLPAGRPPASAFLNPLQPGCRTPTKELASVGVAFTLARGLEERPWDHLDLVALGTVADMAPLVGENRVLVKAGLHRLRGSRKPGCQALLARTKLTGKGLTSQDISFTLAPRLNAMGRMGSAEASLRLLITEDSQEARQIAEAMDRQNKARRALETEAFRRALAKVEREVNFRTDRVIVLEDDRWHPGVLGIVATRLASRFHRPTVVIATNGQICRGSARSIRAFHLVEALEQVKEHLLEFGGHPGAAGLTIARDRIGPFREQINRIAHERIHPELLTPSLDLDAELPLSALTGEVMRDLGLLAPFGIGNPWPIFVSEDAKLAVQGRSASFHPRGIRFQVEDSAGRSFDVLQPRQEIAEGWNVRRLPRGPVRLAYSPMVHSEQDGSEIELRLCDLKIG